MTTNDDAPRDVVAEARALLIELDRAALAIPPVTVSFAGPNLRHLLRALADECDALRKRVAGLETMARNAWWAATDLRISGRLYDADAGLRLSTIIENVLGWDALRAPEPPSRETGADGAKSAPGIPE